MDRDFRRLPPLDPLRGFVAAARALSFTRAGAELFLTQSAISRQVQTLEDALGVKLFERGVRQLRLTAAGAQLLQSAERWLGEYGALAARLAERRRPVTVTASIGISALWLVPRLAHFQQLNPDIDVRIAAGNRIMDLDRDGIDVAVRYCADRDAPPGARRLFGESVVPVASPSLGIAVLDRHSLSTAVLLDFEDPRYPWLRWNDWLAAIGLEDVSARSRLVFSHYDQLIQAAVAGQGVAIGRSRLVSRMIEQGQLVAIGDVRRELVGRGFWLVAASGQPRAEVGRFVDWIYAEAASENPPGSA